ncbi:enolase C-terminal domain-like protein [Daejeonella sp.]|uniref:enolase C-terminal domain-like protein n=1 Tax=Daejeonella sp. TaxID=2805397 RepID=UPI0027309FBD|nr:enolase C-terminal domain-like protein [Daejeonella sp.]MDP2415376.1 enolase C-terminal domain-like protein [Daejeonella sp.]
MLGIGSSAGILGMFGSSSTARASEKEAPSYTRGMAPVKITSVKAIACAPAGSNLIVVKVETSEPGLYGLGCATFTQRAMAVVTAINSYLNDFCVGKDVDNIEDMWHGVYVSSYWRNGPVLNNALSGLDQALWDIKGKRANMPAYQLLGRKVRFAVPCYAHASGSTPEEVADNVQKFMDEGYKYVRIQQGGYGAWHGPGDVSPVGHAANAHIDLAVWNFGIQESIRFSDKMKEVFSGCPTMKNGYMYVNEVPGLGVDINEKEAAKYPIGTKSNWQVRKADGTLIRP